jgi:hypothetical protein
LSDVDHIVFASNPVTASRISITTESGRYEFGLP